MNQYIIQSNKEILNLIDNHKNYLISYFNNRSIFNKNGYSKCVITGKLINVCDISDIYRDNRIYINDNDIQMGHNKSRSEQYVSIRGCNLLPMSRRGNLIIGEHCFTDDIWINELKYIINNINP
jgi:hypothetical protein